MVQKGRYTVIHAWSVDKAMLHWWGVSDAWDQHSFGLIEGVVSYDTVDKATSWSEPSWNWSRWRPRVSYHKCWTGGGFALGSKTTDSWEPKNRFLKWRISLLDSRIGPQRGRICFHRTSALLCDHAGVWKFYSKCVLFGRHIISMCFGLWTPVKILVVQF